MPLGAVIQSVRRGGSEASAAVAMPVRGRTALVAALDGLQEGEEVELELEAATGRWAARYLYSSVH